MVVLIMIAKKITAKKCQYMIFLLAAGKSKDYHARLCGADKCRNKITATYLVTMALPKTATGFVVGIQIFNILNNAAITTICHIER
jgi:hypothetical protein